MQDIQKKIEIKDGLQNNSDENQIHHFDLKAIMLDKVLDIFKRNIEKYTNHKSTKKILSHTKKVFSFFIKNQLEEVLLIINKKEDNYCEIEFKVLPNYYSNSNKLKMSYMNSIRKKNKYPIIISLKDFYLKNVQFYISDSGGSIS